MNDLLYAHFLYYCSYIIPLLLLIIFYYLTIYLPQKKQRVLLSKIAIGKLIITQGGLMGTLVFVGTNYYVIELENGAQARIAKHSVIDIQ